MALKGVVPTFFLNEQIINTNSDICAYILKFLFWNPGSTSNQIENTLLSMRKLSATYAEDINTFPQQLSLKMTETLQRYNPNWRCTVEVINRDDEHKTYGLNLRITDDSGVNVINTDSLMVKDGLLTVKNEMEDTQTIGLRSPRHKESTYSDINTDTVKKIKEQYDAEITADAVKSAKERETEMIQKAQALKDQGV